MRTDSTFIDMGLGIDLSRNNGQQEQDYGREKTAGGKAG